MSDFCDHCGNEESEYRRAVLIEKLLEASREAIPKACIEHVEGECPHPAQQRWQPIRKILYALENLK